MKPLEAIRCTLPSCPCECFSPSKSCLRTCDSCKHGWVAHALDKLGYRHIFNMGLQVEIVQPNIVFDIASLMLYGAQATPIRLKILLDRLFSVLQHEEVLQVLHGFGWTYEDYARGYILQYDDPTTSDTVADTADQESSGRVLDKWTCATREEEYIIMQQFLRFGETKSIAQEIILQDTRERQDLYIKQTSRNESEIKKFIERSNMQNLMRPFDVRHLFGNRLPYVPTPGSRLMSPPITGFSTPATSPRSELRPPLISVTAPSPVTSSPLGRLQTMQPFDYRRETSSPPSASPNEKLQNQQQQQQQNQPQQQSQQQHSTRESTPKSESPQNLSVTSTSAQSSPSHTPFTPQKMAELESPIAHLPIMAPTVTLASMMLPTIRPQGSDDAAINFSIKEDHDIKSYMDRKNKHLRKSSNPIKRNWFPDNFGSPMIGPNGKKRVLCTACNKTFCDKGALKIHYSAVHLKEMHKCSVDGCTMMFSSRRSRNRHSANPNPKLHMPQKRPKVPDGATLVDDGSSSSQKRSLSTPPTMVMNSMVSRSPISMMDSADQRAFYSDPNIQMPLFPTAAKRLKLDQDDDNNPHDLSLPIGKAGMSSCESSPQNLSLPALKLDLDRACYSDADTPTKDSQEESMSEGERQERKSSSTSGTSRTSSRRKNIPTRCAQPTDLFRLRGDGKTKVEEVIDEDGNRLGVLKTNGAQEMDDENEEGAHDVEEKDSDDDADDEEIGKKLNGSIDGKMSNEDESEDCSLDKSENKLVIDDEDDDDEDGIDRNDTGEVLDFSMHVDVSDCENMSDHESNASFASNDSQDLSKNNGDLSSSDYDIPLDKENPKQCVSCGKTFLNVFGLKIHYKNVHLKLMHNCTVAGCSAAFPSKRSRDRHSANLNLHRKLLSTSAEDQQNGEEADDNQNFRADVIQKLYENQNLKDIDEVEDGLVNGNGNEKLVNDNEENDGDESSDEREGGDRMNGTDEELGTETSDGMVSCHICEAKVRDKLILKEHFELNHPREMYQCQIKGCEKIFTTRKSRNRHSQNDNLHKVA